MRKLLGVACLTLIICSGSSAQDTYVPSLRQLRNDYRQVSIVAHVRVLGTKYMDEIGTHVLYEIRCRIVEPFKGRVRRGQDFVYYEDLNKDYDPQRYSGDKLVFLVGSINSLTKRWGWFTLENSTLEHSDTAVARLRRVRLSRRRSRRPVTPRGRAGDMLGARP
jgi:hypothetical protein